MKLDSSEVPEGLMSATLFCDMPLAARIDRAEARMCAEFARLVGSRSPGARVSAMPLAGGLAVYAGPGAPMNKVIGLGLGDVLSAGALAEVEAEWESRHEPVRIELSTLDDGAAARLLTARGYRLLGFENVLGRRVDASDAANGGVTGAEIVAIADEDLERWIRIMLDAFAHPDEGPLPTETHSQDELASVFRDISRMSGLTRYLAMVEGEPAAAASVRFDGRLAQLTGAATLASFRRRGLQTALTTRRLADAQRAGCDLAVVTTNPGSKSQQNAQRHGFELLYARAILVK
jgi:ribosomal protein S18 acetylase RimI-like enzyme